MLRMTTPLRGELQLIVGPMFSGKSTELLRRLRRYMHAEKECLVVKYLADKRYHDTDLATHDLQRMEARPCSELSELGDDYLHYDVIGIDEGQFFPDVSGRCLFFPPRDRACRRCCSRSHCHLQLGSFVDRAADQGKVVIVAALDGTFQREPFGEVCNLIPKAEAVTKLTSVCALCHADAAFTKRIGKSTEVKLIGGKETYMPVCRSCYVDSSRPASPAPCDSDDSSVTDSPVRVERMERREVMRVDRVVLGGCGVGSDDSGEEDGDDAAVLKVAPVSM
eukprot:PLAT6384.2.p1 GENE.PLAT6384.2~~PLAT6384.2.p1  ORF type:complete len:310 (-),score=79.44 PLAT6384.2:29-865(-)